MEFLIFVIVVLVIIVFLLVRKIFVLKKTIVEIEKVSAKVLRDTVVKTGEVTCQFLNEITDCAFEYIHDETDVHNFTADLINHGKMYGFEFKEIKEIKKENNDESN